VLSNHNALPQQRKFFSAHDKATKNRLAALCDLRNADQAWQAPLRQLAISFSHGAKWKALISTYIGTIPLRAHACDPAEHGTACGPSPSMAVSAAMNPKIGAAPSDSQSVVWSAPSLSLCDIAAGGQKVLDVMVSVLSMCNKSRSVNWLLEPQNDYDVWVRRGR
jgi:hypothetical protein